jgi:hypothetical protein
MIKKVRITGVLCLAVFSGFVAPLAGQLNVVSQSKLYVVSTTQIAYQVGQEWRLSDGVSQLTLPRTLPLLLVSFWEASFCYPFLTNWVEAPSSSGLWLLAC